MGKPGGRVIIHCGTVWGSRGCSYLYGIFTLEHAYIGETGNLPTSRWGSHLSKADSSFAEKLKKELHTLGEPPYDGEFLYVGLYCENIDTEEEGNRKFARLALEHAVHQEFLLNANKFWPIRKLLSSSSKRSARIKFSFDIEEFAKVAIAKLSEEYDAYIKLTSLPNFEPEQKILNRYIHNATETSLCNYGNIPLVVGPPLLPAQVQRINLIKLQFMQLKYLKE